METPDNWVIIKIITESETFYKILAGWSGGYLYGNSFRMNSGIETYEEENDYILFYGFSGSVYKCYKNSEMITMNTHGVYSAIANKYKEKVTRIDFEDFKKEFKG